MKVLNIQFTLLVTFMASSCTTSIEKYAGVNNLIKNFGTTFCPYTNLCYSNASQILSGEDLTACCAACSCASDCWIKGNCCPDKYSATGVQSSDSDKHNVTTLQKPFMECVDTIVKRRHYDVKTYFGDSDSMIKRFWVVRTCPESETNVTLTGKCTGTLQTSFEDYIWVNDAITKTIYRNKFCAQCNNVSVFNEWQLSTDCSQILYGEYSFSNTKLIPANCQLVARPPPNEDVSTNLCVLPHISKCNETGLWQTYNKTIEDACLAFEMHFYVELAVSKPVRYRNVFCYLCNNRPELNTTHACHVSTKEPGRGTSKVTLLALLDTRWFKTAEEGGRQGCAIREYEDQFQEKCRRLACPVFTAPLYGTCERLTTRAISIGMMLQYRLIPVWDRSTFNLTGDLNLYYLGKIIFDEFQRRLRLKNIGCRSCAGHVQVFEVNHRQQLKLSSYFMARTQIVTDNKCDDDLAAKQLLKLVEQTLTVNIKGRGSLTLHSSIETLSEKKILDLDPHSIHIPNTWCPAVDVIDLSQTSHCPSLTLEIEDYTQMLNDTNTTSQRQRVNSLFGLENLSLYSPTQVKKKTKICVSDYNSMYSELQANAAMNVPSGTLTLAIGYLILVVVALT